MTDPNVEKPTAAELEDWIRKVAEVLPRDEFIVPKERAKDFLLLYGFCQQAARFASSYVLLSDQGFQREAAALARCGPSPRGSSRAPPRPVPRWRRSPCG